MRAHTTATSTPISRRSRRHASRGRAAARSALAPSPRRCSRTRAGGGIGSVILALLAGLAIATLPGPAQAHEYVLTSGLHSETEDLAQVVAAELGAGATVADFADIKAQFAGEAAAFCDSVGLIAYRSGAICLSNGASFWSGSRHYFLERHDGSVPGGWTVHDEIDSNTVSLGSWYSMSKPVMVELPFDADVDQDGDGLSLRQGDCNESDAAIHPGAFDACGDGVDADCDGLDPACPEPDTDFFVLSGLAYPETADLEAGARALYGPEATLADFVELKALFTGQAAAFCDAVGLTTYRSGAFCTWNGAAFYAGYRHYFIERHDGVVPSGWLVHDQIDSSTVSLGSWYSTSKPILIRLPFGIDDDYDGDGFSIRQGDDDDNDVTIYPGAWEICDDGIDQDCNGSDLTCLAVPATYATIQAAIDAASPGDTIEAAPGTYSGTGNVNLSFGGKAVTLRCALHLGSCTLAATMGSRGLVIDSGETAATVVQGFTITGAQHTFGGGILIEGSSPTIIGCTLLDNRAYYNGGGVYINGGSPRLIDCILDDNTAENGAGVYVQGGATPTLEGSVIQHNFASQNGGGLYAHSSAPVLERCDLVGNYAGGPSAGAYLYQSPASFSSCVIARGSGGGLELVQSSPTINSCSIIHSTGFGGGAGVLAEYSSSPVITNSIIWDNAEGIVVHSGSPVVTFSDIQDGGWPGTGNIDQDPLLVDAGSLSSGDYHLTADSPCIDSGLTVAAPALDRDGVARPQGAATDMGAFERQ